MQVAIGFPSSAPAHLGNISLFLPGHLPLPFVCILFVFKELLILYSPLLSLLDFQHTEVDHSGASRGLKANWLSWSHLVCREVLLCGQQIKKIEK